MVSSNVVSGAQPQVRSISSRIDALLVFLDKTSPVRASKIEVLWDHPNWGPYQRVVGNFFYHATVHNYPSCKAQAYTWKRGSTLGEVSAFWLWYIRPVFYL